MRAICVLQRDRKMIAERLRRLLVEGFGMLATFHVFRSWELLVFCVLVN